MRTYASKPTLIALLLTLTLAVQLLTTSASADELVMPYSCQMVGGRPLLVASSPQTYRISGPHDQRKITICSPADPGRCRAWNVHSFNVNCGGAEVSWPAMIAGSPPARDGRARFENGRFQMSMPPAWNLPGDDPCARNMDAPAAQRDPQLDRYCSDRPGLTQPTSVEMPAGFAPTLGLDIKFNAGTSPVAAAPSYNSPAPATSAARPTPSLTAQSPTGGLNWKASPVAPPQPGALQVGVPFDPDAPPPLPKKKLAPETKITARAEPTLKPALPPVEQPAPVRPAAIAEVRPEPIAPRKTAIEHPIERPAPQPETQPTPAPPVTDLATAAPTAAVAIAPAPAPAIAPPPPPAMPVSPPQTATSESTKITQVAEHATRQEPYSSRPQKLTPPSTSPSLTTILIAASLAVTALGTFLWMRRGRADDDLPVTPRVFAGPGFDSNYDDNTRTVPSLSGPMAADGLHRQSDPHRATPYPADPSFGPYARHAAQEAFDDPLGPVLPEWSADDQPPFEPAQLEPDLRTPDLAHDWAAASHTLDIPDRDETGHLITQNTPLATSSAIDLVPTPHEPGVPSHWAGAADWPTDMPQNQDDALHILGMGVTAKASLPAMKKIVDGLRLSWHPDHATDDADRTIRELRIRQINTAWDILTHDHPAVAKP